MQAEFQNTVSILVKAYLQGFLAKGSCAACAVGNICAASLGTAPVRGQEDNWSNGTEIKWVNLFLTVGGHQNRTWLNPSFYQRNRVKEGLEQIAATGYSVGQLARIEFVFETAAEGHGEEAEFAGLMAAVDVLADIHGIDLATAAAAKGLFVKVVA